MIKILDYMRHNGFAVMMIGFLISVIGLITYMQTRHMGSEVPQIAFGATIVGFAIYVIGRFFVAAQRRKPKKQSTEADTSSKENM